MGANRRVLIILILISIIFGNLTIIYGSGFSDRDDTKEKAYNLGYDDGISEGIGHDQDTSYYRYLPRDSKILSRFEREYGKYSSKYEEDILEYYEDGFQDGFYRGVRDDKGGTLNYPRILGKSLGEACGYTDFIEGRRSNWSRAIPSSRQLQDMYSLDKETSQYRSAFLDLFRDSFEEAYMKSYERANLEPIASSYNQGLKDGKTIGQMKGEYEALIDITQRESNLWSRHKVRDSVLIDEYGLDYQSDDYRKSFIAGYWNGFMKSYDHNYNELHLEQNKVKTYTERISIDGKDNITIPEDKKFLVDIEAGTYYNDVLVTIDSIPNFHINPNSARHVQASGIYGLKVFNLPNTFDDTKKLTIKFKSYGTGSKYGIYKYHYNSWVYIPSRQDENYIMADINLSNIDSLGNIYVVRSDNDLPILYDSRGHWAREEINIYVKGEILYGYPDGSFKPDNQITRGEFVTMLSRLYNWFPPYDSSNIYKFEDYKKFDFAEKPISYAVYYGIVNGYADNTFRPQNPISYREVEYIMNRVLKRDDFKWDYFANKMLYEYGVRCKSKDSLDNKITRAEFVFMLHRLNEAQY